MDKLLAKNGFQSYIIKEVKDIKNVLETLHPAIVLVDYYNAPGTGDAIIQLVKSHTQKTKIPILGIISTIRQLEKGDKDKNWDTVGLDGYLYMPFAPVELERLIVLFS